MLEAVTILGVRIHRITMAQTLELIEDWLQHSTKHYIVTPNVEFIMKAQQDDRFKKILNNADLAIPDSARFGWALKVQKSKLWWPTFWLRTGDFPVVTGTDLMQELCHKAAQKGWTVGLLGGADGVAEMTRIALHRKHPTLTITLAESGGKVDDQGRGAPPHLPKTDILFVAFGQGKQEKWIINHLETIPVKVAMGVGGAFDYISGQVPRAPQWMQSLGLEWAYRLIKQPWRITRFGALVRFVMSFG